MQDQDAAAFLHFYAFLLVIFLLENLPSKTSQLCKADMRVGGKMIGRDLSSIKAKKAAVENVQMELKS